MELIGLTKFFVKLMFLILSIINNCVYFKVFYVKYKSSIKIAKYKRFYRKK